MCQNIFLLAFGPVFENVHGHLLVFAGFAGYRRDVRIVFPGDLKLFEIVVLFHVVIGPEQIQYLIQQGA